MRKTRFAMIGYVRMLAQLFPAKNSNLPERIATQGKPKRKAYIRRLEIDYYVILHPISSMLRRADFCAKSLIAVITGVLVLRIPARQRHGPCPNNSRGEQITAVKD